MGTELPRREMLRLALMSSENRAASSLARNYPGGTPAFVAAMNAKAAALGMTHTRLRRSDRAVARRTCRRRATSRALVGRGGASIR